MNLGRNNLNNHGHDRVFARILSGACSEYRNGVLNIIESEKHPNALQEAEDGVWLCNRLVKFITEHQNGFLINGRYVNRIGLESLGYMIETAPDGRSYFICLEDSAINWHAQALFKGIAVYAGSKRNKYKTVFNANNAAFVAKFDAHGFMSYSERENRIVGMVPKIIESLNKTGHFSIDDCGFSVATMRTYMWNSGVTGLSFKRDGNKLTIKKDGVHIKDEIERAVIALRSKDEYVLQKEFKYSYVYQFVRANYKDLCVGIDGSKIVIKLRASNPSTKAMVSEGLAKLLDQREEFVVFSLTDDSQDERVEIARIRAVISTHYPNLFKTKHLIGVDKSCLRVTLK